jgi:predicted amidohydrolase
MEDEFKVALGQFPCRIGNKRHNIKTMTQFIRKAHRKKARLIVFPEMCITGYASRDRVYELAEPIPGPSVHALEKLTKKFQVYLVCGQPERSEVGDFVLYNTATLIGPEGYIGKYRKMYLPTHSVFEEKRYFRLGYHAPVFDTNLGKLGICICYDIFFPEVSRLLRIQGARMLICISASPAVRRHFFEVLTIARAIENTCYLAYVNLVGIEDGLQFWGGSRLISPSGRVTAQAKYNEEDLIFGDVEYPKLHPIEAFVPTLRDLRPELFESLRSHSTRL